MSGQIVTCKYFYYVCFEHFPVLYYLMVISNVQLSNILNIDKGKRHTQEEK